MSPNKVFLDEKDYYAGLPRKRVSAGMILRNAVGEVLIVKPNYRDFWLLPGGVTEPEESPRAGAIRETKEEVGLSIENPRFVCVEFLSRHEYKSESLHFLFDGGTLTDDMVVAIKLRSEELDEHRFLSPREAYGLLNPFLARRLEEALDAISQGSAAFMDDGVRR